MRVVYGVSGEGLGHVFEAAEIAAFLRSEGHEVKILTYGDAACDALREFDPVRIEGLPLHFNERGLSIGKTLYRNRHLLPFYLRNGPRLRRELARFEPDVFLTAYEPFTTLMAHVLGKPLISMDNQNALRFLRSAPRGHRVALALARWATRVCTAGADIYLVKAYQPHESRRRKVRFVRPIVQRSIRALACATGPEVLVYLTKPNRSLVALLREIDQPFAVYCGEAPRVEGNLRFGARGPGFLEDLARCRAIIGTAGFSLIADAIYLKKPYFGVPLKGQFEQTVNAFFLQQSGMGEFSETPTREGIEAFLARLPAYRERLAAKSFDPTEQEAALRSALVELAARPAPRRFYRRLPLVFRSTAR